VSRRWGQSLFLAAGDWRWPQGWVFLGEFGLSSFAVSFWLLRHARHRALYQRRADLMVETLEELAATLAFVTASRH
jgi:hypothetical protein